MEQLTLNRGKTSYEQPLPVYLNISHFDNSLSNRPGKLKDFVHNYIQSTNNKDIFEFQKRHTTYTFSPYKHFFLNKIVNIFTFTSSIISIITILVIYLFCKHKHIRTIIASLILHKAKEVEAKTSTEIDNRFSNIVKIVLFISDVQHYIPIKLCKTSGSPHLFKITGTLRSEDIRLNKNYLWDTLEINWDKIKLLFNSNEIELPQLVTVKM